VAFWGSFYLSLSTTNFNLHQTTYVFLHPYTHNFLTACSVALFSDAVCQNSSLLGCEAAVIGERSETFQKNILSGPLDPWEERQNMLPKCLESLNQQQCHIPEDWIPLFNPVRTSKLGETVSDLSNATESNINMLIFSVCRTICLDFLTSNSYT
jgi:hypothetical protein